MKVFSPEEFRAALQKSSHGQEYLETVQKILLEKRSLGPETGYNLHHIHPKALGGALEDESNLLKVSCFEHCLLHVLLAKAIRIPETFYPIRRMSNNQYQKCSDLEKITLEDIYHWSEEKIATTEAVRQQLSDSHKGMTGTTIGRIRIHKGIKGKIVKPEHLERFLGAGWEVGVPERTLEHRKKISESKKGKRVSEASKQKNREAHLGKPGGNKGRIFIHKGDTLKRIDPSELETYLADGWEKGHDPSWYRNKPKCRHDAEWKAKVIKANKGRIYIQKDGKVKRIFPEDFPKYAEEGWIKGRPPLNRKISKE